MKTAGKCLLLGSVAAFSSVSVPAQENPVTTTSKDFERVADKNAWLAGVNLGYVGGSSAKFQGQQAGRSDAFNINLNAGTRVKLNADWFLNLGLVSDNYYLGSVTGEPLPDDIHTLRFNTGVGCRWNEKWIFTAMFSPSLYRFEDVTGDDFGFSGGFVATYQQKPSLMWSFGIIGSSGDVPVLPIVGVRWLIDDHYTLEVGMPRTRLSYRVDSDWTVYGGLDVVGTTFRTSQDLGTKTGLPQYNHALGNYHDIRLGVGASYRLWHACHVEVETGCSVYREINYQDIKESIDFKPAPYVRLGMSVLF